MSISVRSPNAREGSLPPFVLACSRGLQTQLSFVILHCRGRRWFRVGFFPANHTSEEGAKIAVHGKHRRNHHDPKHRSARGVEQNLPVIPSCAAWSNQM